MAKKLLTLFILILLVFFYLQKEDRKNAEENVSFEAEVQEKQEPLPQKVDKANTKEATPVKEEQPTNYISSIQSEADFLSQFPGDWQFIRNKQGKITSIMGGEISKPRDMNLFIEKLSPLLAQGEFSLEDTQIESDTNLIQPFATQQKAKGFQVYQGSATVLSRKSDGSIYIINNQLKDIADFNETILVSKSDVEKITQKLFPDKKIQIQNEPVVFSRNQKTELAWVAKVSSQSLPYQTFEALISAETGEKLYQSQTHHQN